MSAIINNKELVISVSRSEVLKSNCFKNEAGASDQASFVIGEENVHFFDSIPENALWLIDVGKLEIYKEMFLGFPQSIKCAYENEMRDINANIELAKVRKIKRMVKNGKRIDAIRFDRNEDIKNNSDDKIIRSLLYQSLSLLIIDKLDSDIIAVYPAIKSINSIYNKEDLNNIYTKFNLNILINDEIEKLYNWYLNGIGSNYSSSLKNERIIEKLKQYVDDFKYNSIFEIRDDNIIASLIDNVNQINDDDFKSNSYVARNVLKAALDKYLSFLKKYSCGQNNTFLFANRDYNKIFYGVPGVGKSYKIKKKCESEHFEQEKTVFHPEYTNADFVGQLLPKKNDDNTSIGYEFEPGPFARILKKALYNMERVKDNKEPIKRYMLVIDEINRGNAAAIFGEIFQLLDRDETGRSEYEINNEDIYKYLIKETEEVNEEGEHIKVKINEALFNNKKIYLPQNLYIWATMNTSDQNVFILDTAFQRRWTMEMLPIYFDADDKTKVQGNIPIPKSRNQLKWREFVKAVNDKISNGGKSFMSTEDKRLGPWFAKEEEISNYDLFAKKVIKYLWDDAFKLSREQFESKYDTLDKIIIDIEKGIEIEDIFDKDFFNSIIGERKLDESVNSDKDENVDNAKSVE